MVIRKDKDERKADMIQKGLKIAEKIGYMNLKQSETSKKLKVSLGLLHHYFGAIKDFKIAIVKAAIKEENLIVIAQAIAAKDPLVKKLNKDLKIRAINSLLE